MVLPKQMTEQLSIEVTVKNVMDGTEEEEEQQEVLFYLFRMLHLGVVRVNVMVLDSEVFKPL